MQATTARNRNNRLADRLRPLTPDLAKRRQRVDDMRSRQDGPTANGVDFILGLAVIAGVIILALLVTAKFAWSSDPKPADTTTGTEQIVEPSGNTFGPSEAQPVGDGLIHHDHDGHGWHAHPRSEEEAIKANPDGGVVVIDNTWSDREPQQQPPKGDSAIGLGVLGAVGVFIVGRVALDVKSNVKKAIRS